MIINSRNTTVVPPWGVLFILIVLYYSILQNDTVSHIPMFRSKYGGGMFTMLEIKSTRPYVGGNIFWPASVATLPATYIRCRALVHSEQTIDRP